MSHPLAFDEQARLEALRALKMMDTPPDPEIDAICRAAQRLFQVPMALVTLLDEDRQWFKAKCGLAIESTPRSIAFCDITIRSSETLVVENALRDMRFADNPLVTGDLGLRFYAGAPLTLKSGYRVGALCILDRQPRSFSQKDREELQELAGVVSCLLEMNRSRKELAEELARSREREAFVAAQREEIAVRRRILWTTLENLEQGVLMYDSKQRVQAYNQRALRLLDLPESLLENAPHVREVVAFQESQGEFARGGPPESRANIHSIFGTPSTFVRERPNGTILEVHTAHLPGGGAVRTVTDITTRERAEEKIRRSEERLRLALRAARMVAWERDMKSGHVERSENSLDVLGLGSGHVGAFLSRVHPDDLAVVNEFINGVSEGETSGAEIRYFGPDGMIWLRFCAQRCAEHQLNGVVYDITDRKAAEAEIWRSANHDSLTGLPNRALFQEKLAQALQNADASGGRVSLLLIDLDEFKDVNDALGHHVGDALLKETARRLHSMQEDGETVARIGGDEFAMILVTPASEEAAMQVADSAVETLRQVFKHDGHILSTRASIGVAIYPDHHRDVAELMKNADIALYKAKAEGRSRAVLFTNDAREETQRRVNIIRQVREALEDEQFLPFYQPKVNLGTGQIVGFEALARWRHPSSGLLTPAYFGVAFADAEIAVALGDKIARRVASDIRMWLDQDLHCGHVAINLSSAEFANPFLAHHILRILETNNVPTTLLEIEVTESVFLGRCPETVLATLTQFQQNGVKIALDDFGTGFASLSHLKRFPVDHIKIDQSFVRDLVSNRDDAAIVAAVVGLSKSLGLEVTAEGVETYEQVLHLRQLGCDYAQGFFYGKPIAGSRVPWLMRKWTSPRGESGSVRALA